MTDGDGLGFSKAALLSTPFWICCIFICTFLPFFSFFNMLEINSFQLDSIQSVSICFKFIFFQLGLNSFVNLLIVQQTERLLLTLLICKDKLSNPTIIFLVEKHFLFF